MSSKQPKNLNLVDLSKKRGSVAPIQQPKGLAYLLPMINRPESPKDSAVAAVKNVIGLSRKQSKPQLQLPTLVN